MSNDFKTGDEVFTTRQAVISEKSKGRVLYTEKDCCLIGFKVSSELPGDFNSMIWFHNSYIEKIQKKEEIKEGDVVSLTEPVKISMSFDEMDSFKVIRDMKFYDADYGIILESLGIYKGSRFFVDREKMKLLKKQETKNV